MSVMVSRTLGSFARTKMDLRFFGFLQAMISFVLWMSLVELDFPSRSQFLVTNVCIRLRLYYVCI